MNTMDGIEATVKTIIGNIIFMTYEFNGKEYMVELPKTESNYFLSAGDVINLHLGISGR